jgi:phenylalanyl-tRNA synthetase beta chain
MKISLHWLKDYIDISGYTPEQIGAALSDRGLPIESIEPFEDDTVIDVEITSNRGDCLSHIGIARELSAAWGRPLTLPQIDVKQSDIDAGRLVNVKIEDPAACGRYTARVIQNVKIGPSPAWLRKRLEAIGLRSVNNVVDATNYAMMEHGQPPHAFDYDKIGDKTIIVRKAKLGERIISIDGTKCDLNESMLVIADAHKPVAVAGVMGGLETEVSDTTVNILLEEAHFDPVTVRRTSRKLALPSDASYRFERQVDADNIEWASLRCAQLITQLAGGTLAQGIVDVFPGKTEQPTVGMRLSRMKALLGIDIPTDSVIAIFKALGFDPENKTEDLVVCTIPTWRHDIYREVDLIEEAARCWGYDKIPTERKIHIEAAPKDKRQAAAASLRTVLTGAGYFETITVSFVEPDLASVFGAVGVDQHLAVQDVNQKSSRLLRTNLLGSLTGVMRSNYNTGNIPCRLFELANTYIPNPEGSQKLPIERTRLGLATDGDFRSLRGAIEAAIEAVIPGCKLNFTPANLNWAQAGAAITLDGKDIGYAGVIKNDITKKFDLDRAAQICLAELDFETILQNTGGIVSVKPIPKFPAVRRDLSLILAEQVQWSEILNVIEPVKPAVLEKVEFVSLYRGKPIPQGQKSVSVAMIFRDDDGTLRHEQVDAFEKTIFEALNQKLSAQLRTA